MSDTSSASSDERRLADATQAAARALRVSGPLPPNSEDVLRFAVRDHLHAAGEYAVDHERSSITGGWRPLPGKLDLHIGKRPHRWAAEAKVWDIGQQIWDALKLVAGIRHSDLETGYLLAAAPPTAFAHYGGAELYAPGRHVHDVRELIVRNATDWEHDLGGGRGRPEELPSEIVTTRLVDEWCWFGHLLRLVRVALANQASIAPLRFDAGWPVGVDPAVAIATAKARPRRTMFDALGLAVPARWSDAWWRDRRRGRACACSATR